jgi:predicted RND superfamily exporter protein
MRDRLLRQLSELVIASPGRVLVVALVLGVVSAFTLPNLEMDAGHSALFDSKDIHRRRFQSFLEQFGSPDVLFALVSGGNPRARREVIDQLRGLPEKGQQVRDVVGRFELGPLRPYGLLYLSQKNLRSLVNTLQDPNVGLRKISSVNDLAALFAAIAEEVDRRARSAQEPAGKALERAQLAMRLFGRFIAELDLRARDDARAKVSLADAFLATLGKDVEQRLQRSGIDTRGYLVSRDGQLHLAIIRPRNSSDEPTVVEPFVRHVQKVADAAAAAVAARCGEGKPLGACKEGKLQVVLTGLPALIKAEKDTLTRDLALTSAVAAVGILLIFIFGFRSLRQGLLGFLPLGISVLCTLAVVWAVFGGLNLVTSAFLPTVLGLGIDFAVHLLSRYNEARRTGAQAVEAVRAAVTQAGPGMVTGGLTTAGAFLALTVNEFKGFVELGVITAVGLVFSLFAALTIGTALLVHPKLGFLQQPPKAREPKQGRDTMAFANALVRHRFLVLGGGVVISVLMVWRAQSIPWSYNYLELLPSNSPAVQAMETLARKTDYSGEVAALRAKDAATALELAKALRTKKTVGRVESLAPYIPTDQRAKIAEISKLRPLYLQLDRERGATSAPSTGPATRPGPPPPIPSVDIAKLREALTDLTDNLQDARFEAKGAGKTAAAGLLKEPIDALNKLRKTLAKLPQKDTKRRLEAFQRRFIGRWHEGQALLRQAVFAGPVSAEKFVSLLPAGLRARLYNKGAFAIYVYPSQWLWEAGFLERFVADLRSVDPAATGWPVTHWEANLTIERGFRTAALLTTLALMMLLFVDFRSVRYTVLAIVPVGVGMAWMWGGISLLGMSYNFANIIGFPLVIGIGVASGVHILHRYRQEGERQVAPVVRHTGLAILLSALTTMAGFGSLALARHQGAASLGLVLLMGVISCLVTATLVLPALLAALQRRRPGGDEAQTDPPEARETTEEQR